MGRHQALPCERNQAAPCVQSLLFVLGIEGGHLLYPMHWGGRLSPSSPTHFEQDGHGSGDQARLQKGA